MCSCDLDGDFPEFQSWSYPRARKAHRCAECGVTIRVGELHEAYTHKWEGDVETSRVCGVCVRLRGAFDAVKDEPHCNQPFWELRSCIRELVAERVTTWSAFRAACREAKSVRQLRAEQAAARKAAA